MGKPMGLHPNPITYSQKQKKGPKRGLRSHDLCFILRSSFDRVSKFQNSSTWPRNFQHLVNGQQAPNTHLWLIPSHSNMGNFASKASSCLNLLLCQSLLLGELLNNLLLWWPLVSVLHLILHSLQKVYKLHPALVGASGSLPWIYSRWHGPVAEPCTVPGTFSSSQPLIVASTALALFLLVSLPPGAVILMSLVQGPLQGTHRSVHLDCWVACILRSMPLFFRLLSWNFLLSNLALPVECLALFSIPYLLLVLGVA